MPAISKTPSTRTGYTFKGYYDNATYTSGTQYYTAACASARNWDKKSATTLYAGWQANALTFNNKTLTFTYNATFEGADDITPATNGTGTYLYHKKSGESDITVNPEGEVVIPVGKSVGTYSIVITAEDANSGATKDATYTIIINKANLSSTVNMDSYTYAGIVSTPSLSSNPGGGTVTYKYNTTGSTSTGTVWNVNTMTSTSLNAGNYYMYAVIGETNNYYGKTTTAVPFTVVKGTLNVTSSNYYGFLDGWDHSISVSCAQSGATITYSTNGTTYSSTNPKYTADWSNTQIKEYTTYWKVEKANYNTVTGSNIVHLANKEEYSIGGDDMYRAGSRMYQRQGGDPAIGAIIRFRGAGTEWLGYILIHTHASECLTQVSGDYEEEFSTASSVQFANQTFYYTGGGASLPYSSVISSLTEYEISRYNLDTVYNSVQEAVLDFLDYYIFTESGSRYYYLDLNGCEHGTVDVYIN